MRSREITNSGSHHYIYKISYLNTLIIMKPEEAANALRDLMLQANVDPSIIDMIDFKKLIVDKWKIIQEEGMVKMKKRSLFGKMEDVITILVLMMVPTKTARILSQFNAIMVNMGYLVYEKKKKRGRYHVENKKQKDKYCFNIFMETYSRSAGAVPDSANPNCRDLVNLEYASTVSTNPYDTAVSTDSYHNYPVYTASDDLDNNDLRQRCPSLPVLHYVLANDQLQSHNDMEYDDDPQTHFAVMMPENCTDSSALDPFSHLDNPRRFPNLSPNSQSFTTLPSTVSNSMALADQQMTGETQGCTEMSYEEMNEHILKSKGTGLLVSSEMEPNDSEVGIPNNMEDNPVTLDVWFSE